MIGKKKKFLQDWVFSFELLRINYKGSSVVFLLDANEKSWLSRIFLRLNLVFLLDFWSCFSCVLRIRESNVKFGPSLPSVHFLCNALGFRLLNNFTQVQPFDVIMSSSSASGTHNFKIVLLGEGAVGKTSIVLRYVEDKFNDKHVSTLQVRIDYHLNYENVRLRNEYTEFSCLQISSLWLNPWMMLQMLEMFKFRW